MSRRRAFTLFDLIVLTAGGALGIGVLLPYADKLRTAAARAQSQNNLKQISLGLLNYESANGALPAGIDSHGFSAAAHILPYIEQTNLFQLIDFSKDFDAGGGTAAARKFLVKTYLNPADPVLAVNPDWGATNYLYSAGSRYALADNDGVYYRDSKVTIVSITDGTSNTLAVGETLKGDGGKKAVDVHRQMVRYKKDSLAGLAGNSGVRDFQDDKDVAADRCASWMDGRFLQGTFSASRTMNDPRPDVDCGGVGGMSGLRSLSDSVHVAYCDGSVRAINNKVSLEIWQALATRAGGEVIPNF